MPEQNVNPRETGDWSVETLFAHLTALIGEVDRRYEQRFTAQEQALGEAFARSEQALTVGFEAAAKALVEADQRYQQRFEAQEQALAERDRRYEQRFQAQSEAIAKAEAANEKRFEGVNEFRDQLRDQATLFMPRAESESRTNQNSEKIDQLDRRLAESLAGIQSRLDLMAGQDRGAVDHRTESRAGNQAVFATIAIVITVILAVITIAGFIIAQGG